MATSEVLEKEEEALQDKLLRLIEEGDATIILSSEYTYCLNELIKNEFVSIGREKLELSEKGRQAKVLGVNAFMAVEKDCEEVPNFTLNIQKDGAKNINRSLVVILFFLLISLLAVFSMVGIGI